MVVNADFLLVCFSFGSRGALTAVRSVVRVAFAQRRCNVSCAFVKAVGLLALAYTAVPLASDPSEKNDLAEQNPTKRKELLARYENLAAQAAPPKNDGEKEGEVPTLR